MTDAPRSFDAVVVGSGISGLYMLYRLREQGLQVHVLEAGSGVGGTWYWNRYPGARVDSQSDVYQYWFSDELLEEWNWPERFPLREDVERYLNHVADRFSLRDHIQLETRVAAAKYDERARRWTVTTEKGETFDAQYVAMCVGGLSAPLVPPFSGHETFRGRVFHTARWPKDPIDFAGQRVAVVGTGATGIQVIQTIAPEVARLTVFQRTPNYAIPMCNPAYSDADRARIKAGYPALKQRVHSTFGGFDYDFVEKPYRDLAPAEREAMLEDLWNEGSLRFWIGGFAELFNDAEINEEVSKFVRAKMRARIRDPEVADKLIPTHYGFGTKRVPLETKYFEAFNQPNVDLVDINQEPIERITPTGIRTSAREYPAKVLVLATGFDSGTGALNAIDIRGREGRSLKELWAQGIRTTMGLQVNGYPNLFTTMAPFAPSAAFCNVPTCVQQQVDWISDCIRYSRAKGATTIEPTREMEDEWIAHHDETAAATLVPETKSWYMGSNVPGKPPRLLAYIGGAVTYRQRCDDIKASGYRGFTMS